MRNFEHTFETRKRSFISAFSICITAPLRLFSKNNESDENFTWYLTIDQGKIRVICD